MVQPFPPVPPPQPPQNTPQGAFAPSPAGTPFQPGAYQAPPPPPQKSGGCFKGCCIIAVILGVIGVVGVVIVGLKWKQMYAWGLAKGVVDQSDLTPDEKAEARDLFEKTLDAVTGAKAGDQKFADQFAKAMTDLQTASADNKIEGRELRPVFARLKQALKEAGYSFPSNLFPMVDWKVTVMGFDESRKAELIKILKEKVKVEDADLESKLGRLPAVVLTGVNEVEAQEFMRKLQAAGCDVTIQPVAVEAPK